MLEKCAPDVVVTTPGKLADHMFNPLEMGSGDLDGDIESDAQDTQTLVLSRPRNLASLRYFIVDEADRLLASSYSQWIDVLHRIERWKGERLSVMSGSDAVERDESRLNMCWPYCDMVSDKSNSVIVHPLRKVMASATMTKNPRKVALLNMYRPIHFSIASNSARFGANDEDQ